MIASSSCVTSCRQVKNIVENFWHCARPVSADAAEVDNLARECDVFDTQHGAEKFVVVPNAWKDIVFEIDVGDGEVSNGNAAARNERSQCAEIFCG